MTAVGRHRTLSLLHLVSGSEWRGRERVALGLAAGLAAKGHRPVVAASAGSTLAERAARAGLEVATISPTALGRLRDIRRLLSAGNWDLAHLHDVGGLKSLVRAGIGLRTVPCVLTVKGDVAYGRGVLPRGAPVKRVERFFASSEWVWSSLVRSGIPEDRIAVIHSAVDLDRFRPTAQTPGRREETRRRLGTTPDDLVVGTVLHLTAGKGVEVLIESVRRIRLGLTPPGEQRVRLLIVGDGPHRARLERQTDRLLMRDTLIFTGCREDVPDLLAAMDVYVHPATTGDGFPVALREAMAMTVPAIATDLMGIREVIDNGKQGLIVPVGDPVALALNIMRLRRDPIYAQQLGKGGSLKVQRYGVQAMVDRAEEVYFRLIR